MINIKESSSPYHRLNDYENNFNQNSTTSENHLEIQKKDGFLQFAITVVIGSCTGAASGFWDCFREEGNNWHVDRIRRVVDTRDCYVLFKP